MLYTYLREHVDIYANERLVRIYFRQRQSPANYAAIITASLPNQGICPPVLKDNSNGRPDSFQHCARDIGTETLVWVRDRLDEREHLEQAFRVCLGLLNLSKE